MRRQWRLRRQWLAAPDGQRRWDRAYQQLLMGTPPAALPLTSRPSGEQQGAEVQHAGSSVCPGLNATAGASPDD